jgi:hypothetical protein
MPTNCDAGGIERWVSDRKQATKKTCEKVSHPCRGLGRSARGVKTERVILGRDKRVRALCNEEGVGKAFQPELCCFGPVLYGIPKKTRQFASVRG